MYEDTLILPDRSFLLSPGIDKVTSFSPRLNLAVMASGNGTNFEALVIATRKQILAADISLLIVSNPDCEAIKRAIRLKIPYIVLNHKEFHSREDYDNEIVRYLEQNRIEGVVMAGWMRIVSNRLIDAYPDRLINIHPSILPSFRGIDAIDQALKAKVKLTGCSVHLVEAEVDSGPILIQAAVPIYQTDNKESLSRRIQTQEHKILPMGVSIAGRIWRRS